MKLKPGASLKHVQWQMFDAAVKADEVYARYGHELVITAGTDGRHMAKSLHYKGLALDLRTRTLPVSQRRKIENELRKALGPEYDLIYEGDHFHVEYDPK